MKTVCLNLLIVVVLNFNVDGKMQREYTLSIIKPDATSRDLVEEINQIFLDNGLEVVAQKKFTLTQKQAEEFYLEHKDRPFYRDLVNYMTSGEVVVQVLAGENAVIKNREVMGATNPANAKPGTVRAEYGESMERNSVHGSDSLNSAKREISFFFDYNKITS